MAKISYFRVLTAHFRAVLRDTLMIAKTSAQMSGFSTPETVPLL